MAFETQRSGDFSQAARVYFRQYEDVHLFKVGQAHSDLLHGLIAAATGRAADEIFRAAYGSVILARDAVIDADGSQDGDDVAGGVQAIAGAAGIGRIG